MSLEYLTVDHISTKDLIRVFSNIEINPDISFNGTPCWIWCANRTLDGYGLTTLGGERHRVHRLIFSWLVHPLPKGGKKRIGGELDHLCHFPSCCNPLHLEFVSGRINQLRSNGIGGRNARKTHCDNGHEFTPDNLLNVSYGRRCKTCVRERMRKYRTLNPERQKAASNRYIAKLGREELRRRERERYHANIELSRAKLKMKREKRRLRNRPAQN